MANLVVTVATSHTPLLCLSAHEWEMRAKNDRVNPALHDTAGVQCTYDELLQRVGGRYHDLATRERWNDQCEAAQRHLDRLSELMAAAKPDVAVIVGDDQLELFTKANLPAISIFYGDVAMSHPMKRSTDELTAWRDIVASGYGMDKPRPFAAAPALGRELIELLVEDGFDVGAADSVRDPERNGFGHAYGFIVTRLMGSSPIPIVPVLLNTYFPPNQPTPARCYALGRALRKAIEASSSSARVALIASGGLSHFVTNEELDRSVMDALRSGDKSTLSSIPSVLLQDGSSEIRNWITIGGALDGMTTKMMEYLPVYRTEAGTGIGMGFAVWS